MKKGSGDEVSDVQTVLEAHKSKMKVITYRQWDGKEFRYWGLGKNGAFHGPTLNCESDMLTPIKDVEGKDLWENDIAEITAQTEFGSLIKVTCPLIFDHETAQFMFDFDSAIQLIGIRKVKKVGTIYQHKHLLTDGNR